MTGVCRDLVPFCTVFLELSQFVRSGSSGVETPVTPTKDSVISKAVCGPKCESSGMNHSPGECAPPPVPPPAMVMAGIPSEKRENEPKRE